MQEIRIYMHYEKNEAPEYAFLEALGFDKNKDKLMCIIEELKKQPLSALELSKTTGISRSVINYHLETLVNRGIVYHYARKFHLAGSQFTQIIQYIEMETTKKIKELKEIAKKLDSKEK